MDARGSTTSPTSVRGRARVVLVDDHAVVREGLRELFATEPSLWVVGEAADAETAFSLVVGTTPDIVVLDLSLGREMAFPLLEALKAHMPNVRILVLSMQDENVFAEVALASGASGYVGKHESSLVILAAVHRLLEGKTHLSVAVADKLLGSLAVHGRRNLDSPMARLSDREVDVLRRIGAGRGTREIAAELRISAKTVETHRSRLKEKLNVRTASELVVLAVNWLRDGFLDVERPP